MTASGAFAGTVPPAGTRVLIVGGCGAIGRGLVDACTGLGHEVAVMDLPRSIEERPPTGDTAVVLPCNATDPAQVESAFAGLAAAWGALDVLFFVAGFTLTPPRPTEQIDAEQWDEVLRGNLTSAHLVTRAALPLLRKGNQAGIVTVSSGMGVVALPGFGPYSAAKAGLIALTKTLALEHAPSIRVNGVAPSAIDSDFMRGGLGRTDSDGSWFNPAPYVPSIPLGRLAEVTDVIGPMLFLASPAATFVTGQTLHINGGRFMA